MDQGFPAHLFRISGSPEAIEAATGRYQRFGQAASQASSRITSLDTSQFTGSEGDQFRQKLNSDLPPRLHLTGQAFSEVAHALADFAAQLAEMQAQMRPLADQAPGAWQRFQAAKAGLVEASHSPDQRQHDSGNASAGHLEPPGMPTSSTQAATHDAQASLSAAQQEWDSLVHKAAGIRAEMIAASDRCSREIRSATAKRFQDPPGMSDLPGQARDFFREHQGTLKSVTETLKRASAVVSTLGVALQAIPGVGSAIGGALLSAGVGISAVGLVIDQAAYSGTGAGTLTGILVGAGARILPSTQEMAGAAVNVQNQSASQAILARALARGPSAVSAAWSTMSLEQQHELIDRCPQLVGGADGLPAEARSAANTKTLAAQRQVLENKLQDAENRLLRSAAQPKGPNVLYEREVDDLRDALRGLDAISGQANKPDMYLLSLDADANGRGQVVLAHGNPDIAQHVLTTVPGTYSDLGDAMDYVHNGDTVMHRAQQLAPNQSFSSVTWVNYEAPKSLLLAGNGGYANDASANLSNFQQGLRASHAPDLPPSNNTVIGHSYGSTVVGYAARDHGLPVNNIGFIGSPGVGVDKASDLHLPRGHVWSGTADLDVIQYATPSPNPVDYFPLNQPDHLWYGVNPSDPRFGARQIPTDWSAGHSGYWSHDQSIDGMARIVANQGGPAPR